MANGYHKPDIELPFKYVDVYAAPTGTQVNWQLNPEFHFDPIPTDFYVEYAKSGGEWTRLNTTPITDLVYVDTQKRRFNYRREASYRVIADDGSTEHASLPSTLDGVWNKHDWLIGRDIIRKEYLRLQRYVGTPGWLMKRRISGVKCDQCRDFDTDMVTSSVCPNCMGTGYQNAFYNAIPFYMDFTTSQKDIDYGNGYTAEPMGHVRNVRAVAYPKVEAHDVWIAAQTGEKYLIRTVADSAAIRDKPLVYTLSMFDVSGIDVYDGIQLEQTPPDPTQEQEGWATNLDYQSIEW